MKNDKWKIITVNACKYDGSIHRNWTAELIEFSGALIVLDGVFDRDINHSSLGLIKSGTRSIEYYWLDRWYNVFRFIETDGALRNYYCNVNVPPNFEGNTLSYIDLDLDILVAPDLKYSLLDEYEFEINQARFNYASEVRIKARESIEELISLIEKREFPFDFQP
jgi:hypothetical protein